MRAKKKKACLHCELTSAILKHGVKCNDDIRDVDIVGALATVIGDVLSHHDDAAKTYMREWMSQCIAEAIKRNHDNGVGRRQQRLHS
jgi:hypothetical protein